MINKKDLKVGQIVEVYLNVLDITLDAKILEIVEDDDCVLLDIDGNVEDLLNNHNYELRLKKCTH